jgi:LDH2 family malate/lactate/ureidoglycolate dehydrogenase
MSASGTKGIIIGSDPLRILVRGILCALRVPGDHAEIVGQSLVAANLRGLDSHGVELLGGYVRQLKKGGVNCAAVGSIVSENGCCVLYDGCSGLGQVVSDRCARHAIRIAGELGVSLVVARNSHHYGAAGFWAEKIASAGFIGISMSNAGATVPHWGGRTLMFGTNPLAMAVPGGRWTLDMATSTVAHNKLSVEADWGHAEIPREWAFVGTDGRPTTDRCTAEKGWSTPLGGYKGSGLAMLVEILCAGLSGGPMAADSQRVRTGEAPLEISHMFMAIDPRRFLRNDFERRVAGLADMVRASVPAEGFEKVMVAGDREGRTESLRLKEGIPLPAPLWARLQEIAAQLGVISPEVTPISKDAPSHGSPAQ